MALSLQSAWQHPHNGVKIGGSSSNITATEPSWKASSPTNGGGTSNITATEPSWKALSPGTGGGGSL